ncbi:conserved hypothetical protein [Mycobacterium tuberculosis GM 1503]|nr:conserved hypothetical protein [Mycobacterium tuberculosis GM 1503]
MLTATQVCFPNASFEQRPSRSPPTPHPSWPIFERYPELNEGVKGAWVLARYDDGRPSQVRLDTAVQGIEGTYIHAVYYPGENQIQTVMQQGELFAKQEQLFSVVATGAASLLTVDMDVQVTMPVPEPMVKMLLNNVLEHLAENLKQRAEQLAAS